MDELLQKLSIGARSKQSALRLIRAVLWQLRGVSDIRVRRTGSGFKLFSQHLFDDLRQPLVERFCRRLPVERLSWLVESRGHGGDLVCAVDAQVGADEASSVRKGRAHGSA